MDSFALSSPGTDAVGSPPWQHKKERCGGFVGDTTRVSVVTQKKERCEVSLVAQQNAVRRLHNQIRSDNEAHRGEPVQTIHFSFVVTRANHGTPEATSDKGV